MIQFNILHWKWRCWLVSNYYTSRLLDSIFDHTGVFKPQRLEPADSTADEQNCCLRGEQLSSPLPFFHAENSRVIGCPRTRGQICQTVTCWTVELKTAQISRLTDLSFVSPYQNCKICQSVVCSGDFSKRISSLLSSCKQHDGKGCSNSFLRMGQNSTWYWVPGLVRVLMNFKFIMSTAGQQQICHWLLGNLFCDYDSSTVGQGQFDTVPHTSSAGDCLLSWLFLVFSLIVS
jgi:hypothetical protein